MTVLAEIAVVLETTEKNVINRIKGLRLLPTCTRCNGSGHYSFNQMHGTMCYGCSGSGQRMAKDEELPAILEDAKKAKIDGRFDEYLNYLKARAGSKNATEKVMAAWKATEISKNYDWRRTVPSNPNFSQRDADIADINAKMSYADFKFKEDPGNEVFLVRVYGSTGHSFSVEDTHWDMEIFKTEAEADALALQIDYLQDLLYAQKIVKTGYGDWRDEVPKERISQIEDDLANIDERYPLDDGGYFRKFTYVHDGVELPLDMYMWNGYFETFYYVRVVRLTKAGYKNKPRDRRYS